MKRILLSTVAALGLITPAFAQVNFTPQPGITAGYLAKNTYSSGFFGLVPVVTSGTDEVCITGSASKIVRVQRITIYGTTTTAAQTLPIALIKHNIANTGGTKGTTTANPGVVTQISSRDTGIVTNLSATATLASYTVAPTTNDAAPTYVDVQLMNMPFPLTSTQAPGIVDFYFGRDVVNNIQPPTLRGITQELCVNITSAITNASVWSGSIVWTEE